MFEELSCPEESVLFLTSSRLKTLNEGAERFSPIASPDDLRLENPFGNLIGIFE